MGMFIVVSCIIITLILTIYAWWRLSGSVYVRSSIDEQFYLVRDLPDKQNVANILAQIKINVNKLIDHMLANPDPKYISYINILKRKFNNVLITENINDALYTSYSLNKGDQLVFCLRSRKNVDEMHDINLLMYVVLHEISHIACPEYQHTDLFKEIFRYITKNAIDINVYKPIDFKNYNKEYCGMMITDSIV